MLRLPYPIRKFISKHRKPLAATAPVIGEIENARSRLAHQEKQLEKWNYRLKYGRWGDMSRQEIKAMRDQIAAKVPYWQDRVISEEMRMEITSEIDNQLIDKLRNHKSKEENRT